MATNLKRKLLNKTIGKTAYWSLNKQMVKSIGLESTLILQHIIDLQEVFKTDEVFQSQPDMATELGISEYAVKNKIVELSKSGYINVVKKGVPCKNYYTTNDDKIIDILVNGLDHTKSTDLPVDSISSIEVNGLDHTKSTDLLVSNQLTSDTEIVPTITNNTNKEYTNNTELKYSKAILDRIIDKFISVDNRFKYNSVMIEINEDYGGFDNLIEMYLPNDTSAQNNYRNKLKQYNNGIFA